MANPGSSSPPAQQSQVLLAEIQFSSCALPESLARHSAWNDFLQKLCTPPPVNHAPPVSPHPTSLPSKGASDADITQQEDELALARSSHDRAAGRLAGGAAAVCCTVWSYGRWQPFQGLYYAPPSPSMVRLGHQRRTPFVQYASGQYPYEQTQGSHSSC